MTKEEDIQIKNFIKAFKRDYGKTIKKLAKT